MDDLIAFLKARLDEDERGARALGWTDRAASWRVAPRGVVSGLGIVVERDVDIIAGQRHDKLEHIARHDPARVLREVEAKRRMIALAEEQLHNIIEPANGEDLLKCLALPYSDHPDYQERWKP